VTRRGGGRARPGNAQVNLQVTSGRAAAGPSWVDAGVSGAGRRKEANEPTLGIGPKSLRKIENDF
jgi:hypothetical protein